ncbi:MAG: DedA family protein [Candidatus Dormibacteraceae bacterium]
MSSLHGYTGPVAIAIASFLLFIEEAGVPLPIAPGEAVLIAAGLIIASGRMSIVVFLPAACGSVLLGALAGYAWAHHVGMPALRQLADRFRVTAHLERASLRMRGAGPGQITVSRLVPGLRIYTSLLAGAVGVDLRAFVIGATLAVVPWVVLFTLIGLVVGVPAEHLFGRLQSYAVRAAVVVVVALGGVVAIRHIPPAGGTPGRGRVDGTWWRLPLALLTDLVTVASVVVGLDLLTDFAFQTKVTGVVDTTVVFGAFALIYLVAVRRSVGSTGGETLLDVSYWAGHRSGR